MSRDLSNNYKIRNYSEILFDLCQKANKSLVFAYISTWHRIKCLQLCAINKSRTRDFFCGRRDSAKMQTHAHLFAKGASLRASIAMVAQRDIHRTFCAILLPRPTCSICGLLRNRKISFARSRYGRKSIMMCFSTKKKREIAMEVT